MFVGHASILPSGTPYKLAWDRLGIMARCTKPCTIRRGGLGNPVHIVWDRRGNFGQTSLRVQSQIGDKPGLESCVVSQVVPDTLARLSLEGCRDT